MREREEGVEGEKLRRREKREREAGKGTEAGKEREK